VPEVYHADILLNLIEDLHRHTDDTVRIGNVASYDQAMREVLSSLGRRAIIQKWSETIFSTLEDVW